jgi:hypothetical protein
MKNKLIRSSCILYLSNHLKHQQMKKKIGIATLAAIFALLMIAFACQKDQQDEYTDVSKDQNTADVIFNEVKDIADEAYNANSKSGKSGDATDWLILGTCATITLDTTVSPRLLTIDFGTVNCLCNDGKYRRGMILISFTGHYKDSGTVITHTFSNYFVNDHQVLGTKTITNNGLDSNGYLSYSVVVNGSIIKPNNGGTITWNSIRTRTWIAGMNTPGLSDDKYEITGSASGTSAANVNYTMLITTPLQKNIGCKHFVSGVVEITPANKPVRVIDYGTGTCDNIITITVNNHTFTVYL